MKSEFFVRPLDPAIGEGVAERTFFRTLPDGRRETWADVAHRVAYGNTSLTAPGYGDPKEYFNLRDHIAAGRVLMSGRHLQQGDHLQFTRNLEVFTNCATAAASFAKFYLLLNGSGVGRSYDDDMMVVNWDNAPEVVCVLDRAHPDHNPQFPTPQEACIWNADRNQRWFTVPDSREGWAKALELLETMTYEGTHADTVLVLDFSFVRAAGQPIAGMQNRPAAGPIPLMQAIQQAAAVKGKYLAPWKQAMWVDHYLAECVQVGGARRAARIAVKFWKDPGILEFINIKKDGGLWSSNNSVGVDAEFWQRVKKHQAFVENGITYNVTDEEDRQLYVAAYTVFNAVMTASYDHATGEPGLINLDRINANEDGLESLDADFMGYEKYMPNTGTRPLLQALVDAVKTKQYKFIVNPCGEIPLFVLGGYCVIADVVPFHCDTLEQALDAFKAATRALIRTNLMPSLYQKEVRRTNRIGVGFTGIFEFAWKQFGLTWHDLVNERASAHFWEFMMVARIAVTNEATAYAKQLGVNVPHTFTTVKPAGTTSKLFNLTEGAHLLAMTQYLRWVQFDKMASAAQIAAYEAAGYPVQHVVKDRPTVSIVGFPTRPLITTLGIPAKELVTADHASMEEQFAWVRLLERFWLGIHGNQVSYTLKYDRRQVTREYFAATILKHQPLVRCISVMPSSDWRETKRKYGYVPEEPLTASEFDEMETFIRYQTAWNTKHALPAPVDLEHLQCAAGACPI